MQVLAEDVDDIQSHTNTVIPMILIAVSFWIGFEYDGMCCVTFPPTQAENMPLLGVWCNDLL